MRGRFVKTIGWITRRGLHIGKMSRLGRRRGLLALLLLRILSGCRVEMIVSNRIWVRRLCGLSAQWKILRLITGTVLCGLMFR